MKKSFLLVLVLLLIHSPFALTESMATSGQMCPVSGEKATGKSTYIYQGKTYSFCCPKCLKEFKKHPEKYVNLNTQLLAEHSHH